MIFGNLGASSWAEQPSAINIRATESVSIRSEPKIDSSNVIEKVSGGTVINVSRGDPNVNGKLTQFAPVIWNGKPAWVDSQWFEEVEKDKDGKWQKANPPKWLHTVQAKIVKKETPVFIPSSTATMVPVEEGFSTGTKIAIAGGAVVAIGLIVYFATRK